MTKRTREFKTYIVITFIIAFLLGMLGGWGTGAAWSLNYCIDTGIRVLDITDEELGMSKTTLLYYIKTYTSRIENDWNVTLPT